MVDAVGSGLPALTAAVEQKPDVVLLDLGADDYVIEPFTAAQLTARIWSRPERSDPPPSAV